MNNTVIDWFEPWPEQALESVAATFLGAEDLPGGLRPGIVAHMVGVHQSVRAFSARFEAQLRRHNYVTVRARALGLGRACRCLPSAPPAPIRAGATDPHTPH